MPFYSFSGSQNPYIWFRFPQYKGGILALNKRKREWSFLVYFMMGQKTPSSISGLKLVSFLNQLCICNACFFFQSLYLKTMTMSSLGVEAQVAKVRDTNVAPCSANQVRDFIFHMFLKKNSNVLKNYILKNCILPSRFIHH